MPAFLHVQHGVRPVSEFQLAGDRNTRCCNNTVHRFTRAGAGVVQFRDSSQRPGRLRDWVAALLQPMRHLMITRSQNSFSIALKHDGSLSVFPGLCAHASVERLSSYS